MANPPDIQRLSPLQSYTQGAAVNIASTDFSVGRTADAIFVGGAGNVTLGLTDGTNLTFTGILAGTTIPMRHSSVIKATTTATNMVSMWQ